MGLFDRVNANSGSDVRGHALEAALRLLARGKFTRAQVEAGFNMDTADKADLTLLINAAGVAPEGPVAYASNVGDVIVLIQEGLVNKSQAAGLLDL